MSEFSQRYFAEVFQLRLLVVRVDRNGHGTYFGTGIQECQPIGHIAGPDAYVRIFFHADGQQTFGHVVHTLVKLFPRKTQVAVGIYNVFFVRRHFRPMLQPVA